MAYTKEQLQAINEEGSNIIVSAGAGSGKTAVLTERVIRKLNNGVDIDKLLVLTFTNEAANEMKNRIRKNIISNNLTNQLSLLSSAYITTFDSFALSIVKKYHYLLNVTNNLKIIDSNIITMYKYEFLDTIFENMYGNSEFDKLIDAFCLKDDKNIKDYIINVYDKLSQLVDQESYLDSYLTNNYSDKVIDNQIHEYEALIATKITELNDIYSKLKEYLDSNLIFKLDEWFKPLNESNTYDEYVLFTTMIPVRFTKISEYGISIKDELKEKVKEINEMLRFSNTEEIKKTILETKDYAKVIIDIIKKLDVEVKKYKHTNEVYEFNDISHMAIDIVKNNPSVANELKYYFNEIMIDEYQDTSTIQDEFISYIANNNVYMVGDIKQSIYRFRNANPYIFKEKYDKYSHHDNGLKIDLTKNFRSRNETINNINEIFNIIMDDKIGNANYQKEHNMIYGNIDYDIENTMHDNKMEIYNYKKDENKLYTNEEKELFIISEDINNKIKNNYQIFDKETKKLRNLEYKDICIITDRNKYLPMYRKILEYMKIPSIIYMDESLNSNDVILVIKNLISLVNQVNNNNYDDTFRYCYTSVARSFIFGYTDDMIYDILNNKTYVDDNITNICQNIDIDEPLPCIINNILNEFKVYEKLISIANIEENIIRIDNLINISNELGELNYNLEDFVNYINNTIKLKLDVKYTSSSSSPNAVKIMNIHKSKGLEFSLCYYTGMHNKFAIKEITSKFIISNKYGMIIPYLDDSEIKNTIIRDLYINNYYEEEISEKIRLLYVALTRAREKIIIVTSLDTEKDSYDISVPYPYKLRYRSFLDILNSVMPIKKYIVNKEANYTHDYEKLIFKEIIKNDNSIVIDKQSIKINYEKMENKHFSKSQTKLLDNESIKNMEYGTKVHESLEFCDIAKLDNPYLKKLFIKIPDNYQEIYREYEFAYDKDNTTYNGVIDLMVEYKDNIKIIDYKLKNITDDAYRKQLHGYKEYIESISNKKVTTYLYSIIDNKLEEV